MPWNEVMRKFKGNKLHSGSKHGPKVKDRKQAIAIMLSEKKAAKSGKSEYDKVNTGPSDRVKKRHRIS